MTEHLEGCAGFSPSLQGSTIEGKIVLPCRPKFRLKGRSFFLALFDAGLAFGPATLSRQTSRPVVLVNSKSPAVTFLGAQECELAGED